MLKSVKLPFKCVFFAMLNIVIVVDRSFVIPYVHVHMLIPYVQYVLVLICSLILIEEHIG